MTWIYPQLPVILIELEGRLVLNSMMVRTEKGHLLNKNSC